MPWCHNVNHFLRNSYLVSSLLFNKIVSISKIKNTQFFILNIKIRIELNRTKPSVGKILDAVDEFHKDNIATIDKLKKKKQIDTKRINGALKQSINAHGPITKLLIGSASKRIYGSLVSNEQEEKNSKKISLRDVLIGIGITTLIILIHQMF